VGEGDQGRRATDDEVRLAHNGAFVVGASDLDDISDTAGRDANPIPSRMTHLGHLASSGHLMRGKIELFGLDTLVNMIGAAGMHVEMRISDAA
jgi:hypothetical protein